MIGLTISICRREVTLLFDTVEDAIEYMHVCNENGLYTILYIPGKKR